MRRLPIAPLLFAASLAVSLPASAQGLSAQDEANARFQTGLKYYDARDFESARLAFTQAYAVLQKPSILLNLALSELYSNHALDAIAHFEQYIGDASMPADKRDKAKRHLDEAMKKTGHLQLRTAPGAEVKLDGRALAPPYGTVHVMPGAHTLEASLGGRSRSASVDAKAGETTSVDLAFEGDAASAAALAAPPSAAPPADLPPPPEEPPPASPTATRWGTGQYIGAVGAGAGVLAIVGGALFLVAKGASDDGVTDLERTIAENGDTCSGATPSRACQDLEDKRDERDRNGTVGVALLVGGGLALAAGITTFLVSPRRASSAENLRILPIATGRRGGFVLRF